MEHKKKHFSRTCYNCGKKGHRIIDCYKFGSNEKINEKAVEVDNLVLCSTIAKYDIKNKTKTK